MNNVQKVRVDSTYFWLQVVELKDGTFNARYWPVEIGEFERDCNHSILGETCFGIEAPRHSKIAAIDHALIGARAYVRYGWSPPPDAASCWD